MRAITLAVATLAAFSSCVMSQVVPEANNTEFKPTGETSMYNRSAAWDAVRVRSPKCNLAKRTDGSWGGTFADRAFDVSVTNSKITGVEFNLTREMSEGNHTVITGQFQGRIYRFEFDEKQALIRTPNTSVTLPGRTPGENKTTYGGRGELLLNGEAAQPENAPWPQFGFALMAMFN